MLMAFGMLLASGPLLLLFQGENGWHLRIFTVLFGVEAISPVSWRTAGDLFGRKFLAAIPGRIGLF